MTGQTIIFISGDQFLRAGRTKVVGTTWRGIDGLKQTICCDTLTGIYIYSVIDFSLFAFTLSRLRNREVDIQTRGDKVGVFCNLEGVWFGSKQIVDFKTKTDSINLEFLESEWNKYWSL